MARKESVRVGSHRVVIVVDQQSRTLMSASTRRSALPAFILDRDRQQRTDLRPCRAGDGWRRERRGASSRTLIRAKVSRMTEAVLQLETARTSFFVGDGGGSTTTKAEGDLARFGVDCTRSSAEEPRAQGERDAVYAQAVQGDRVRPACPCERWPWTTDRAAARPRRPCQSAARAPHGQIVSRDEKKVRLTDIGIFVRDRVWVLLDVA